MAVCTMEELERGAEIAKRHPGWNVWSERAKATRAHGNLACGDPPKGYTETVIAGDYEQLDRDLDEQDAIYAARKADAS